MRIVVATLAFLAAGSAISEAQADPYRWCAHYGSRTGATNCYFMTLPQCRAAIAGLGGFCRRNPFYTGGEPRGRSRRSY